MGTPSSTTKPPGSLGPPIGKLFWGLIFFLHVWGLIWGLVWRLVWGLVWGLYLGMFSGEHVPQSFSEVERCEAQFHRFGPPLEA